MWKKELGSDYQSFTLSPLKSSRNWEGRGDFFSRVRGSQSACTFGSVHCPLLHLDFINVLVERWQNAACVCESLNIKSLIYPSYLVVSLLQHLLWAERGIWTLSSRHLQSRDQRKTTNRGKGEGVEGCIYRERGYKRKETGGSGVRPWDYLGHQWQWMELKCKWKPGAGLKTLWFPRLRAKWFQAILHREGTLKNIH